jgi:hypothetical protein
MIQRPTRWWDKLEVLEGEEKGVTEGTGIRQGGQMTAVGLSCCSKKSTANQKHCRLQARPSFPRHVSGFRVRIMSALLASRHNLNQGFFDLNHLTTNEVFQQQTPTCGEIELTIPQHKTLGEVWWMETNC